MKNSRLLTLVLFSALMALMAGCGANPEKALIGKWVVDTASMTAEMKDNPMAEQMAKSMTIEFKEDKSFTMTMIFPAEGTWSLAGDVVTLDVKKAMGMEVPADQKGKNNLELKISGDGKTLTAVKKPDDKSKENLVFKKEGG